MAKTDFKTVDDYLAAQPEATQRILSTIRMCLHEAVPHAEETISYQIPCFKLKGKPLLFFAGWKQHFALYPAGDLAVAFKQELAGFDVSKGTIRFPLTEPVPVALIQKMARFRALQMTPPQTTAGGSNRVLSL